MKIIKVVALILIMAVVFSGCSLNFFSVESLLTPPSQGGENGEILEAFYNSMKESVVQLKAPVSGEYQTSFVRYDLNGDGVQEALVFYSDSSTEGSVRVALMECIDDEWTLAVDIKGAGNGIYDIHFIDINDDAVVEIFISWTLMDSQTTRIVSIFEPVKNGNASYNLTSLGNEYGVAKNFLDFNSDGKTDLALVYIDDTDNLRKSYLRFFTLDDEGVFSKYGEVAIDGNILSVSKIYSDFAETGTTECARIFIDCIKSEKMKFTEMIYWDSELSVPVRAYSNPAFTTARNSLISVQDIDNDGLYEIPVLATLHGDANSLSVNIGDNVQVFTMLEWTNAKGDSSVATIKTLLNPIDNYLFTFPWEDKVTVKYDSVQNILSFCLWDPENLLIGDELFSIRYDAADIVAETDANSQAVLFASDKGTYYYDITEAGETFGITDNIVESSFITLN